MIAEVGRAIVFIWVLLAIFFGVTLIIYGPECFKKEKEVK